MRPTVLLLALLSFALPLTAQSRPTADHAAAVAAWLASEGDEAELLAAAVDAVLAAGKPALRDLGDLVRAAERATPRVPERVRKLELLLRDVALGFLEAVRTSEMRFAGQFEPLEPLQPWVGRIYTRFVLDTPEWFPDTLRVAVVPALRDLYPEGPRLAIVEQLRAIAVDEVYQPAALRHALACALAQWGDRTLIEKRITELEQSAGDGATDDELHFVASLAQLHYELREFDTATRHWLAFLRGKEQVGATPAPVQYYNAACSASLAGRTETALDELEACAAILQKGDVDESLRLERSLFERDPDLRAVRPTRRFQALVEKTFGPADK